MDKQTRDSSGKQPNTESSKFMQDAEAGSQGILLELIYFLKHSKKWWLAPIILALLIVGGIIALGGTAVAPLIYTLF